MTTYRFTGPRRVAVREGICSVCGKKGRRQTTIQHTVNPFNRHPDGSIKTYEDVAEDVKAQALAWEQEAFVHAGCEASE